ncbi:hypothetical protein [uncultured Sphaerochaeta sp.]|uniref:hypothetical protein n=1 Tax=uncultured Sphaerochaeta sp. TaxID=886478 RepID=UPI0029CAA624|nr:hypothetical protein [uncultured Sphaerochaeta sp.]
MEIDIRSKVFAIIKENLEKKKFSDVFQNLKTSNLSIEQYSELLIIAEHVGCSIEILACLNEKVKNHKTTFKSYSHQRTKDNNKRSECKLTTSQEKYSQCSSTNQIRNNDVLHPNKVIAYSVGPLRVCVCDTSPLVYASISLGTYGKVNGYACPCCKRVYVHNDLLKHLRGKKKKNAITIIDIQKLRRQNPHKKVVRTKQPIVTSQKSMSTKSNTQKSVTVFLAKSLPRKCRCGSINLQFSSFLPEPLSSFRFSGYYCRKCHAKYIMENTYQNLSNDVKERLRIKKILWEEENIEKHEKQIERNIKPKHWWNHVLESVDSTEEFVFLEGKGVHNLKVVFGIDFGASTTKIVANMIFGENAAYNRAISFGKKFSCEKQSQDFLILSQIQMLKNNQISMCGEDYQKGKILPYFKSILVNEKYIDIDPDEVYYAIFFLANILKQCMIHLNTFPNKLYKKVIVKLVFGMPVSHTVSMLANLFSNIFIVADQLKLEADIDSIAGYDFSEWKALCIRTGNHLVGKKKQYIDIRPEIYSEVIPIFQKNYYPSRRAIVVDIGSSTLDIAYVFTKKPALKYVYIPIAEVAPLGVEVAASVMVIDYPNLFTSLFVARDAIFTGNVPINVTRKIGRSVQKLLDMCRANCKMGFQEPSNA